MAQTRFPFLVRPQYGANMNSPKNVINRSLNTLVFQIEILTPRFNVDSSDELNRLVGLGIDNDKYPSLKPPPKTLPSNAANASAPMTRMFQYGTIRFSGYKSFKQYLEEAQKVLLNPSHEDYQNFIHSLSSIIKYLTGVSVQKGTPSDEDQIDNDFGLGDLIKNITPSEFIDMIKQLKKIGIPSSVLQEIQAPKYWGYDDRSFSNTRKTTPETKPAQTILDEYKSIIVETIKRACRKLPAASALPEPTIWLDTNAKQFAPADEFILLRMNIKDIQHVKNIWQQNADLQNKSNSIRDQIRIRTEIASGIENDLNIYRTKKDDLVSRLRNEGNEDTDDLTDQIVRIDAKIKDLTNELIDIKRETAEIHDAAVAAREALKNHSISNRDSLKVIRDYADNYSVVYGYAIIDLGIGPKPTGYAEALLKLFDDNKIVKDDTIIWPESKIYAGGVALDSEIEQNYPRGVLILWGILFTLFHKFKSIKLSGISSRNVVFTQLEDTKAAKVDAERDIESDFIDKLKQDMQDIVDKDAVAKAFAANLGLTQQDKAEKNGDEVESGKSGGVVSSVRDVIGSYVSKSDSRRQHEIMDLLRGIGAGHVKSPKAWGTVNKYNKTLQKNIPGQTLNIDPPSMEADFNELYNYTVQSLNDNDTMTEALYTIKLIYQQLTSTFKNWPQEWANSRAKLIILAVINNLSKFKTDKTVEIFAHATEVMDMVKSRSIPPVIGDIIRLTIAGKKSQAVAMLKAWDIFGQ